MDKSLPRLWIRVELKMFMAGGQKHNVCKDYKRFSVASSLRRIALEYHNGVEVQRKFSPIESKELSPPINLNDSQQRMERNIARKSRITDSFFDAKERLEETFAERRALLQQQKLIPPVAGAHPDQTVIVLSDTFVNTPIGIEVSRDRKRCRISPRS
uniref:Uncharacterized protein n=1 Tax=Ascaris lumbricoides TaxID=6252 RepID=A0A0M3IX12_ASCLU